MNYSEGRVSGYQTAGRSGHHRLRAICRERFVAARTIGFRIGELDRRLRMVVAVPDIQPADML